ncbi:uncharacterized protein EV422DRAFT_506771 [Fimicolochytrium jonesii]|uniref:uncharacterized protein n=1 Tax=Fimicolochytrium jonesii TaxID=1396493 RepID=UPI0022FF1C59|nr:uncharacterized protein EV422DRAFT_506771 [Fimicolochytrium jonesii]KAI8820535.1 hypothetical protein EV422DRAFT_506771 [Fimicolochytrium jonesii]
MQKRQNTMELAPKRIKIAKRTVQRAEPGSLDVINNEVNRNEDHIDLSVALDLDNIFDIDPMNLSIEPLDSHSTQNTPTINKPDLVGLQMDVNQNENVMIDNQTDVNNDHPQERLEDVPDRILPGTQTVIIDDIQIDNPKELAENMQTEEVPGLNIEDIKPEAITVTSTAVVVHKENPDSSNHDISLCDCRGCTKCRLYANFAYALRVYKEPKSGDQWITHAADFFEFDYGHLIRLGDKKGFLRCNPSTRTNICLNKIAFTAYVAQELFDMFNAVDQNATPGAKNEITQKCKKVVDILYGRMQLKKAEDPVPPVDNSHLIAFRNGYVYDRNIGESRKRIDEDGEIETFNYDLVEWDTEKYPTQRYLWDAICKIWPENSDRYYALTSLSTFLGSRRGIRELLIFHGESSNGKSLIGGLMKLITCHRFLGATAQTLQRKPGNGNEPSEIHWKMGQKSTLVTWFSEGDEKDLYYGSAIKIAVGGDSTSVRRGHNKCEQVTVEGLVILATNHYPYLDCGLYDKDHKDITAKLVVIPCKSTFVDADEHFDPSQNIYLKDFELDRLIQNASPDLASAMMALMISFHNDHLLEKEYPILRKPASVVSATEELITRVHPYRTFLKEMCVIEEGAKMSQCVAIQTLRTWMKEHPVWYKSVPRTQDFKGFLLHAYDKTVTFGQNIRINGVQTTGYHGVRLKNEDNDGGYNKFLFGSIDILARGIEE